MGDSLPGGLSALRALPGGFTSWNIFFLKGCPPGANYGDYDYHGACNTSLWNAPIFHTSFYHSIHSSQVAPNPQAFTKSGPLPGILFCWTNTIGIWPMACLPVVNLEIPPHKSQSAAQSVHSICPLHGAMPSLCLPKGLEFGFANRKISTDCHYSISRW